MHLKRLCAPRIEKRAKGRWVIRPSPGPHPLQHSLPLLTIVRDVLGLCDTAAEGRRVISRGEIWVDGKPRKDYRYPVGLMDLVSIPRLGKRYRVLAGPRGKLKFVKEKETKSKEGKKPSEAEKLPKSDWKLVRIENKTQTSQGLQLNLHDGRNLLIKETDKWSQSPGDALKIELPSQRVLESVPLAVGTLALILGGKHVGQVSRIKKVERGTVWLENFETVKRYVFPIGVKEPQIRME